MTLRTRLLLTFVALGAVPLLVVGWVTNQRNLRAVEDLVAGETRLVAERVAEEIGERHDARLGEVLFLAENEETLRLFGESSLPSFASAANGPEAFLSTVWESLGPRYRWIQFRDGAGRTVLHLSDGEWADRDTSEVSSRDSSEVSSEISSNPDRFIISETIFSPDGDRVLGRVSAAVESAAVLPANLPDLGFGERGFVAVIDPGTNRVLYHPDRPFLSQTLRQLLPIPEEQYEAGLGGAGPLEYSIDREVWAGSLVPIRHTGWMVLSSSPLQGFSQPFQNAARTNLLLVFTITVMTAAVFLFSTLRTTRSLVNLTSAARRVAEGDLEPDLPPPGRDEVGTLSGTFRIMLARIRSMIRQVEENRQMAAVGEFSAQIAHELRNPLTAIRMSLQGLHRKLGETEHARPLEIALQETARLDRVAGGVLSLGRRGEGSVTNVPATELVRSAIRAMESELQERRVELKLTEATSGPTVRVDEEAVRGALINLFRNSVEAMPGGGTIEVMLRTGAEGSLEIHIRDSGPGVPADIAEDIFDPFLTTKERGNGFGLPLALRAVEANGGRLWLQESRSSEGAHFILEIPTGSNPEVDTPGNFA